jgi:beta-phosphoglucomutase-like phosphatase (HAD superfamily)
MFDVDVCGIKTEKKDIQELAGKRLRALSQDRIKKLIVFEDAPSGISSAKSLGYYVVGVLRIGNEEALKKAGADIVTKDLEKIKIEDSNL